MTHYNFSIYDSTNDITFETIYQEDISNANQLNDQLPAVLHYGINTQLLSDLVGAYLSKDDIHPIEASLFNKAKKYLNDTMDAQFFLQKPAPLQKPDLYPNNVVLIDIFVRDNNYIKEYENTNLPETHTVVLWRKKDKEFFLIDPSQKSYSDHFIKIMEKQWKLNLPSTEKLYGIADYAPKKPAYSTDSTDPSPRDCIDIAVKIAFELNEQQKLDKPLEEIEKSMLNQISNSTRNAPHLAKVTKAIIRELQSSNFNTRTSSKEVTEKVNNALIKDKVIKNLDSSRIKNYSDIQEIKHNMEELSKFYV